LEFGCELGHSSDDPAMSYDDDQLVYLLSVLHLYNNNNNN